jgi:LacI family transcriptional regulator
MYQCPYAQSKIAFETLVGYLAKGSKSHPFVRFPFHVIFRSNISVFSRRVDTNEELEKKLVPM